MLRRWRRPQLVLLVLIAVVVIGYVINALNDSDHKTSSGVTGSSSSSSSGTVTTASSASSIAGSVALSTLPTQVAQTLRLITAGGPFPYSQDGVVFENRERRLPSKASSYYHEYTVPTPGSGDRGARRIVTGTAGEIYYTADHYETFRRVDPNR